MALLGADADLGFTGVCFCSECFSFNLAIPLPSSSSESLLEEDSELLSLEASLSLEGGALAFVSLALDFVGSGGGLALATSDFCFAFCFCSSSEESLELELLELSSSLETGFCDAGAVLSDCCGFFATLTPVPAAVILPTPFPDPFVKVFFVPVFCFEMPGAFWSSDESSSLELLLEEDEEGAVAFFVAAFVEAEVAGFLDTVAFAGSTSASLSESELLLEEELEVSRLCFPRTTFCFVLLIEESFFAAGLVAFTVVAVLSEAASLVGFAATGTFLVSSSDDDSLEEEEEEELEEEASAFFFSEAFTVPDFDAFPLVSGSFGVGAAGFAAFPLLFSSSPSDSELLEELELELDELLFSLFLLLPVELTLVSCAGFDFTADASSSDSELLDELSEELEVSTFDVATFGAPVDLGFSAVGFTPFFTVVGADVDCFTCASVSISGSLELESLELELSSFETLATLDGGFLDVVLDDDVCEVGAGTLPFFFVVPLVVDSCFALPDLVTAPAGFDLVVGAALGSVLTFLSTSISSSESSPELELSDSSLVAFRFSFCFVSLESFTAPFEAELSAAFFLFFGEGKFVSFLSLTLAVRLPWWLKCVCERGREGREREREREGREREGGKEGRERERGREGREREGEREGREREGGKEGREGERERREREGEREGREREGRKSQSSSWSIEQPNVSLTSFGSVHKTAQALDPSVSGLTEITR